MNPAQPTAKASHPHDPQRRDVATPVMRPPLSGQAATAPHPRYQTTAAWLAFFLGWAGAHAFYLGRRDGWLALGFSAAVLGYAALQPGAMHHQAVYYLWQFPLVAGFVQAGVLALQASTRFDRRYNPGMGVVNTPRWTLLPVVAASLLIGTGVLKLHMLLLFVAISEGTLRY